VIFVDATVQDDFVGALAESVKIGITLRGLITLLEVLVLQDPNNKSDNLGPGGETLDATGEEDVASGNGWDAGLILAAQGKVNLSGSAHVGDEVGRGGVSGNHLGRVTTGEGCT
jgi:hypothetical protein